MTDSTDDVDWYDGSDEDYIDDKELADAEQALYVLSSIVHQNAVSKGFWEVQGGRNAGEAIALMHSELSEALEELRKSPRGKDKHCTAHHAVAVEFADCIIRILDFCRGNNYNIAGALVAKVEYNMARPYKHGKEF